jgi:hypothetical protein
LHLALLKNADIAGLHGGLYLYQMHGNLQWIDLTSFYDALFTNKNIIVRSDKNNPTILLTIKGIVSGKLIGGTLDMIITSAECSITRYTWWYPIYWSFWDEIRIYRKTIDNAY